MNVHFSKIKIFRHYPETKIILFAIVIFNNGFRKIPTLQYFPHKITQIQNLTSRDYINGTYIRTSAHKSEAVTNKFQ